MACPSGRPLPRSPFWTLALLVVGVALIGPGAAHAATQPPAALPVAPPRNPELARLLEDARRRSPAIEAARLRWQASRARVAGEGLPPDPMLSVGAMNLLGLQGPQVTASQAFPLGGKLALAREAAEREAEVARWGYLTALNRVAADVKVAYYELYYLHHAAATVARTRDLMARMSRIATTRYAVGQGKQGDPLRANVQVSEMLQEGIAVRQQADAAAARLRGLLDRTGVAEPHTAIAAAAVTFSAALPPAPALADVFTAVEARNPELGEARAMVAAAETALASAGTIATPDLSAQVGIGRAYMDMGWMTALSGMVGVSVPFPYAQARRDAAVEAGRADVAARRAALDDRRREARVRAEEVVTQLRRRAEQLRLYQHGILPQARQALQAELANYQTNRSDFDAWLAAQVSLYRYERESHEAFAEYHKMRAELDALTGASADQPEDVR